jgi:hypothetical protein
MSMTIWRSGRVHVAIHDAAPPTDAEWTGWLELIREARAAHPRFYVETHGGGPDAKQRRALGEVVDKAEMRVAVLTESLVARGIVTALAWLGFSQRAFGLTEQHAAFAYLELEAEEVKCVLEELPRLRADTGLKELKRAASG